LSARSCKHLPAASRKAKSTKKNRKEHQAYVVRAKVSILMMSAKRLKCHGTERNWSAMQCIHSITPTFLPCMPMLAFRVSSLSCLVLAHRNVHRRLLFHKLDGIVIQVLPMLKTLPILACRGSTKIRWWTNGGTGSVSSLVWYEDLRVCVTHQPHFRGKAWRQGFAWPSVCVYNTVITLWFLRYSTAYGSYRRPEASHFGTRCSL
jgi:hypothetical protein